MSDSTGRPAPWYAEVTRYQWLVLVIASAGWVFDTFEGQLFNITRSEMLPRLLDRSAEDALVKQWGDWLIAAFLVGGTVGGIAFGSLADRFGRKPIMAVTILFYSIFSGLTYYATTIWQVAALRFLVALGVGGEWAVAAALVAEVFPPRARARASGIFHATSTLGTWLAMAAGVAVGANWRLAYLLGIVPALLVLWVRSSLHEPERWQQSADSGQQRGRLRDLLSDRRWFGRAVAGCLLAAIGLGTFWGVTISGQNLAYEMLRRTGVSHAEASLQAKYAFGFWQTLWGGIGLLSFGPLAEWLGRRGAFALMHVLAFLVVPMTCFLPQTYTQLLCWLPAFGFCTLSIHAGYAVYFPELFPNHLRATGTGVCFNGGRLVAAPMLIFSGNLKALPGMDLPRAVSLLSGLFLVGVVLLAFLPETKGRPLPE